MSNWAVLLQDLLIRIAGRIKFLEDFLSFGRVCRSWRSVAVKENFKGTQLPWLMLAEDDNSDYRRFVTALHGNPIDNLLLPEAKGKRCFETLGWLVTLSEIGDMNLLHPISRFKISLPHISTFKHYLEGSVVNIFTFIQKAVLSSQPGLSSKENNFVLMVIHGSCGYLGFWKPGDKAWTTIETYQGAFYDITYYNGQFYAVNTTGNIFVCDVWGRDPTVAHLVGGIPREMLRLKRAYIVESKGEVLVVVRDGHDLVFLGDYGDEEEDEDACSDLDESRIDYGTSEFRVFKVDLSNREWAELQSLGDNALFVGDNASISVQAAKFQGIRPNCIYFTDDCWPSYPRFKRGGGKDMGIYNMEDRSVAPCYKGGSFSRFCPPLWVRPYF
ncbi:hypothetical protein RHSIM_Rhsim02G0229700 [Rhododendron simsii]|uniref:KIB1-4 beta-propeller domain-containing protein n=1 Tax=Rhododendron simsii TaxID=118357 RepID=A0A834HC64_RHOSS|nr:hypothetical protein RHSIM_Rhsim02G0229700 [Rhododendron simsii]